MITFETKIWENDWRYILEGDYLDRIIKRCQTSFEKRILFINNVEDKKLVEKRINDKIQQNVIDEYHFVEHHSEAALKHFNIEKQSFNGGYYYSISELVSIYLCQSEFLLHFSGDSYLPTNNYNWISKAIHTMHSSKDIVVANAAWNHDFNEAKQESHNEIDDFYVGYGFSDQCYLVKTDLFKQQIYNEQHPLSKRYPKYGGELFEKRVDSYMRNHNLKRITSKTDSYIHKNFSKNKLLKNVDILRKYYVNKRLSV